MRATARAMSAVILTAAASAAVAASAATEPGQRPPARELDRDADGDGYPDEAPVAPQGDVPAAPAAGGGIADQISVMGTIRGGDSPTLRDTAVLLDTVTGKTLVLAVGQCLPRLPRVCIKEIRDKTVLLGEAASVVEVARIDGAQPKSGDGYEGSGGRYVAGDGGAGAAPVHNDDGFGGDGGWNSFPPPPPQPQQHPPGAQTMQPPPPPFDDGWDEGLDGNVGASQGRLPGDEAEVYLPPPEDPSIFND